MTALPIRAALMLLTHAVVATLLLPLQPTIVQGGAVVLDEIIVVARKREEPLQLAPLAVTAFTREHLEARKLTDISEIAAFTPNMVFDFTTPISGSTNSASVFIRGVGQTDYVPNKDPGVGVYLDGVYITRSVGSVLSLMDVERVEVLRGPQGTLFGKNTIGGAVNVVSVKPSDVFEGEVDMTLGTFDRTDVRAWVNTPIADTLSARWSAGRFRRDGYMRRPLAGDRLGDNDAYAARIALRWLPLERFEADFAIDYARADEASTAARMLSTDVRVPASPYSIGDPGTFFAGQTYNVLIGAPGPGASTAFPFLPPLPEDTTPFDRNWLTEQPFESNATGPNYSRHSVRGFNATVAWELPRALLTSISGYRTTDANFGRDPDGSPLLISESEIWVDYRQFTQELRFSGPGAGQRLDWVAGLFLLRETGKQRDFVPFVDETFRIYRSLGIPIDNFLLVDGPFSVSSIDSVAAFTEGSFALTEKLELTAGVRWTREEREAISNIRQGGVRTVVDPRAAMDFRNTSGRIILSYGWSPGWMGYLSYSEGFKSGGFNHRLPRAPASLPLLERPTRFEPEEVKSFEVGVKSDLANGRARLGAAVFRSRYRDTQLFVFDLGVPRTINAAAARIDGLEIELDVAATQRWRANLAYGYADARFTRLASEIPSAFGGSFTAFLPLTLENRFVNTPRHALALGTEARFDLGRGVGLRMRADASYRSEVANDAVNTPELIQGDLWLLSASLGAAIAGCRCEVSVFGRNLTNEQYFVSGAADSASNGTAEVIMARPREWGLRVSYRFGG
jgi:iron complex outermembrane recepter protein